MKKKEENIFKNDEPIPKKDQKRQVKKLKRIKPKNSSCLNKKRRRIPLKYFGDEEEEEIDDYIDINDYFMSQRDLENLPREQFECFNIPKTKEEHSKYLEEIIKSSDIILEVLDFRDPNGTRISKQIETKITSNPNKFLVLVLNKEDLVSNEFQTKVINTLKKDNYVLTLSTYKREKISEFYINLQGIINLYLKKVNYAGECVQIGIIGYPNVGKSSLLHSLKLLENADNTNKNIFFNEERNFSLNSIVCTIFDDNQGQSRLMSKCEKDINNITRPFELINNMFLYVSKAQIEKKYDIVFDGTFINFCAKLGEKFSIINQQETIYRIILTDILNGKISYEIF